MAQDVVARHVGRLQDRRLARANLRSDRCANADADADDVVRTLRRDVAVFRQLDVANAWQGSPSQVSVIVVVVVVVDVD